MSITFCICGVEVGRSGTANETPIARQESNSAYRSKADVVALIGKFWKWQELKDVVIVATPIAAW
jgi:hypothetical protein